MWGEKRAVKRSEWISFGDQDGARNLLFICLLLFVKFFVVVFAVVGCEERGFVRPDSGKRTRQAIVVDDMQVNWQTKDHPSALVSLGSRPRLYYGGIIVRLVNIGNFLSFFLVFLPPLPLSLFFFLLLFGQSRRPPTS